ncbi:testicular haploid expressed gene protein-like [Hirundo rustica]|uniref:testicular haploid expressed gene protein-like n=1 Tax=Hirundo rustica TaxID=43150 RepID=UPI001A94EA56|nr:testicular haploid expressed gene protein-like [Hirundo rustica]
MAAARDLYVSSYIPYTCVCPRSRIHELAEPKPVLCESSPTLVWGNQETIWTLSGGAMTARPSARVLYLSKPKKDFSKYQHRAVIGGHALLTKFGYPSERLLRLAEPKKYLPAFLEKRARESPEWPVSLAAQNYNASQRILELARPKGLHPDFMPPREVSRSSQKVVASPRTIELAKPKQVHSNFKLPRDPEWPVTEAAKRAVATPRILELAQPASRARMGLTAFNPDAFRVKKSALKAVCSQRLQELAQPVRR